MTETIKWYKIKCSFYEQEIGIHAWKDVINFVSKHVGFDYEIIGQTTEPFTGVDAVYKDDMFYKI